MEENTKYTIGEFSEKTNTSIRTLRYYDEISLLNPEKHPSSGHRLYTDRDVLTLQKIVIFKFLGYRLDEISAILNEPSFDLSLKETLHVQKLAFEEKKEQIETALRAINRAITLIEEEEEVDSAILMSLISNVQTEKEQRQWVEQRASKETANRLFNKTEEEMIAFDKRFIHFSKRIKQLMGKPVDAPEVQQLIAQYMTFIIEFIGEDALHSFADIEVSEIGELEKMVPIPFTEEEQQWLEQAMDHYMKVVEAGGDETYWTKINKK